jgi:peroxiredoxin
MTEKSSFLKTQLWSIILIVVILRMGVEILLLVRENQRLRKTLTHTKGPIKTLNPEDKVPSLAGVNLDREEFKIEYPSSKKTVLFWFSAECPSCEYNLEFWKGIYEKYRSEKLRFIGITTGEEGKTEEFAKKFQLKFPILLISDFSLLDKYRVEVIPQTMLIDTDGGVQKVWPGPLSENEKKEIEGMISLSTKP